MFSYLENSEKYVIFIAWGTVTTHNDTFWLVLLLQEQTLVRWLSHQRGMGSDWSTVLLYLVILPSNTSSIHYYLATLSCQYNHIWVFLILGRAWFWPILALCSHLSVDVFYECGSSVSGLRESSDRSARVVTDGSLLCQWCICLDSVFGCMIYACGSASVALEWKPAGSV